MRLSTLFQLSVLPLACHAQKELIDAMKHDIQQLNSVNFDKVLETSKHLTVSSVWYFKSSNHVDRDFLDEYNKVAIQNKKMLKILAFDCEATPNNEKHCARLKIESTPHIRIYPQTPQPHFEYTGEKTAVGIQKVLTRLMGSKVTKVKDADEFKKLKTLNPSKQKIFLFTSNKKIASVFKGMSTDSVFARTAEFYFVGEADSTNSAIAEAANAHKQKKYPVVMMISKGKTTWYGAKKDQSLEFLALHEWINVNSESGMGDKVKDISGVEDDTPAESELVKEMHMKTYNDICFKQKNICALYLQDDATLSDADAAKIVGWESHFDSMANQASNQGRTAARFSWTWADVSLQQDLLTKLKESEVKEADRQGRDEEEWKFPTLIMVKPPKRKRDESTLSYLRIGGDVSTDNVKEMVEKVISGSTWSKGNEVTWKMREKVDKKKGKEEL